MDNESENDLSLNEKIVRAFARSLDAKKDQAEEDKAASIARERAVRCGLDPDVEGEKARQEVKSKRSIRSKNTGKSSDPPTPAMPIGRLRKSRSPAPSYTGMFASTPIVHSKSPLGPTMDKIELDPVDVVNALVKIMNNPESAEEVKSQDKLIDIIDDVLRILHRRKREDAKLLRDCQKIIDGQTFLLDDAKEKETAAEDEGDSAEKFKDFLDRLDNETYYRS